jgi:Flp pilus assembly protein TadD
LIVLFFYLRNAVKLNPDDSQILYNLSVTYQQAGDNDKAQYYFNKAKEINSHFKN